MKVLIISYAFPPDTNSQAQHVYGLYMSLSKYMDVDVITSAKSSKIYDNNIYYVPLGKLHNLSKNEPKTKTLNVTRKNNLANILKKRLIPDTVIDWYPQVIKFYKNNISKEYDYIIGIATPYTDLLIANRILKLSSKKDSKLILVYADPWAGELSVNKANLRKKFEELIEKKLLNKSNMVYMVTKNAMEYYKKIYPFLANKIEYYYLGHNFNPKKTDRRNFNNDIVTLSYFGTLQSVHRDPFCFFKTLDNEKYVGKLKVRLFLLPHISHTPIIEYISESQNLKNIVEINNALPYKDMTEEVKNSDYNIIFGNSSKLQIPGKLFDYIGLKSRIFYLKNLPNEEIENILSNYGSIIVNNNELDIANALDKILQKEEVFINEKITQKLYRKECYKKIVNYISKRND